MLDVGQPFPNFTLPDQDGRPVSRADLLGAPTVIYFYPKDDTPGCTQEACEFRDLMPRFEGVRVVGVSPDSAKSHRKFADKFGLRFTLLADTSHELADACGVWVEKSMYGRTSMGVERSTFLLDAEGTVRQVWRKVKAAGHAEAVRAALVV